MFNDNIGQKLHHRRLIINFFFNFQTDVRTNKISQECIYCSPRPFYVVQYIQYSKEQPVFKTLFDRRVASDL